MNQAQKILKKLAKELDVILFVVAFNIGMHLLLQIVK
jgi:hypothetical protein